MCARSRNFCAFHSDWSSRAERRAAIAGDEAAGLQPGERIALPLEDQQPDERLDAGEEDASGSELELVVERDVAKGRRGYRAGNGHRQAPRIVFRISPRRASRGLRESRRLCRRPCVNANFTPNRSGRPSRAYGDPPGADRLLRRRAGRARSLMTNSTLGRCGSRLAIVGSALAHHDAAVDVERRAGREVAVVGRDEQRHGVARRVADKLSPLARSADHRRGHAQSLTRKRGLARFPMRDQRAAPIDDCH